MFDNNFMFNNKVILPYIKLDPVFESTPRFLNLEKIVVKPDSKGLKFGNVILKPSLKESPNKF
jgi:hypothetical protein